jgi:hypothetical protein
MHEPRLTFLASAAEARAMLVLAEVEDRWDEESALMGMTIGALAAHLARAVLTVQTYLASPVHGDVAPMSAAAYFARTDAWSDRGSELNVGIRARAAQGAADGVHALIEAYDSCVSELSHTLALEPDDRLVEVHGQLVLPLDEYLVTRILELTLHTEDLCVSIGRPSHALSGMAVTIQLLVDMAELRHGKVAVLRALARRERDAGDVLRVL